MNNSIKTGALLALGTTCISGMSIFYNKIVTAGSIDPVIFNVLKNGGVGLVLTLLIASQPKTKQSLTSLSLAQWKKLALIALVGGSIPFILFFSGLALIPGPAAALIHKSLFVWVALLAIPLLGERVNGKQLIGYSIIAWFTFFAGGFRGLSGSLGELMVLAATLLWAIENIIAKVTLKDTDSIIVAWARMFLGSLYLLAFAASQGKLALLTALQPGQLLAVSGSILFLSGYVMTWYSALKRAPATLVSSILVLGAPITTALTVIFLSGTVSSPSILQNIGLISGVILIGLFGNRKPAHTS